MHILHVTPHLPPDQAANALLPWQLGTWALAAGDTVEYIAHPPRARGIADLAGPVAWIPRRQPRRIRALLRIDAVTSAYRIPSGAPARLHPRGCRPRAQQRTAGRGRGAARAAAPPAGGAHDVRHRDLALPAEAAAARSVHARLPGGDDRDVLQRPPARPGARARPQPPPHGDGVSRRRGAVRVPRPRRPGGDPRAAQHLQPSPADQRQAAASAGRAARPAGGDERGGPHPPRHPAGDLRDRAAAR